MWLGLKKGESVRIAKKNILVKKWVRPIKNTNSWVPVLRKEIGKLEFNKVLRAKYSDSEMKLTDLEGLRVEEFYHPYLMTRIRYVESGFHSYRLFAIVTPFYINAGTKYYAVIPKGSEYAIGENGDIVSTRIIVFSNLWRHLTWKLRRKID